MNPRKKKILYKSQNRGTKEMDILIGNYAEKYLDTMSACELLFFESLINERDLDLYDWITCAKTLPKRLAHPLMHDIINYNRDSMKN